MDKPPIPESEKIGVGKPTAARSYHASVTPPRFGLLDPSPEDRKRWWVSLGVSPVLQVMGIAVLVWSAMALPSRPNRALPKQEVLLITLPNPPSPPKSPPRLPRFVRPMPKPVVTPSPRPVEIHRPEKEQAQPPIHPQVVKIQPPVPPAPHRIAPKNVTPVPTKPKIAKVRTGLFNDGSSAKSTVRHPIKQVQTGGFGSPHGFSGETFSHGNVAMLGSFNLPEGAGHGNGTGGTRGVEGVVASAGFGNGVATTGGERSSRSGVGAVHRSGFGNVVAQTNAPKAHRPPRAPALEPVVILSKPNPVYPPEARRLHLEGEVLLDVVFEASGKVRVVRVVRGLGHGMDQAAIRAAEQIQFKPAQREGRPVNSEATLHIIFQLAN